MKSARICVSVVHLTHALSERADASLKLAVRRQPPMG